MKFSIRSGHAAGVAFDIGTASVSAALFELHEQGGKPHVIKVFRRFHTTSLQSDALHFSKSTMAQFSGILDDIKKFLDGKPMPKEYTIGLSSIFYLGKTARFFNEYKKPTQLKETDIADFFKKGSDDLVADLKRDDVVVFESALMKALLNGYPIDRPIGRSAERAEIWIRLAATSQDLHQRFSELIYHMRPDADITFSSFPLANWRLMKNMMSEEHTMLLVDIGGEITEVTFIQDGVLADVMVLPFGVLNILLRMSEMERIDVENAFSLLKGYTSGALSDEAKERVRGMIKRDLKSWEELFERVWQRASRDMMIDIRMFFLGGGALVEELKNAVAPPLLHPDIAKGLRVSTLAPEAFRERFGTFAGFDGPQDFSLMSLILNKRV